MKHPVAAEGGLRFGQLPPEARPRERLLRHGPGVLTDGELLAVILRSGVRGRNVLDLSQALLQRHGGLRGLFGATAQQLEDMPGLGPAKVCQLMAIVELARRSLAEEMQREHLLNRPELVRSYCATLLGHQSIEICMALFLDTRLRLIAAEELSRGTLSQATIYPRELVRAALRLHASTVILVHNHPSGVGEPSAADIQLTKHVSQALRLVDVRLADHIVVAGHTTVSMAMLGLVP